MPDEQTGFEAIEADECRALLGSSTIGRLALSYRALPIVLPVNFALCGDDILIRTGGGTKLDAACHQSVVAFEVDGFEPVTHTGWSVLVQGRARVVVEPAELADARRARLAAWANPEADSFIKIGLDMVTGRRLGTWYWGEGMPTAPIRARRR